MKTSDIMFDIITYAQERLEALEGKRYRSSDEDAEKVRLDILLRKYEGKEVGKVAFSYVLTEPMPMDGEDRVSSFVDNYVRDTDIKYMDDDWVGDNACTIYYGDMHELEQFKNALKSYCNNTNTHLFVIVQGI